MNKKLITVVMTAVLSITSINMVKADTPKPATVAILDTALNVNLPVFKDKIVQEVCILEWNSCANGSNFMEGPGAASMPLDQMARNGFNHGTKMTHASIITNPNIKVVFVRIVGATSTGSRQITNEPTFVNALTWVLKNKDKYNISAVAMSQGHGNFMPGSNYCPSTPQTQSVISQLDASGVPVFLPAGNNKDLTRVFWPACIPQSVAVSAVSVTDGPAIYTNYDKLLTDMFAIGRLPLVDVNGFIFTEDGTSVSTQVAASVYVGLKNKYPLYTKQQILDFMKLNSYPVKSKTILGYVVSKDILNG
jgi:hypothetical protein